MECCSLLDLATVRVVEAWTATWWREDIVQGIPHHLMYHLAAWMSPEQLERGTALLMASGVNVNRIWRQHCVLACIHLATPDCDHRSILSKPPASSVPKCRRFARWVCRNAEVELSLENHGCSLVGKCGRACAYGNDCLRQRKAYGAELLWCESSANSHLRFPRGNDERAKGLQGEINWCHVYFQFIFMSCFPLMPGWITGKYMTTDSPVHCIARHLPWEVQHCLGDHDVIPNVFSRLLSPSCTAKCEGISLAFDTLKRWAEHAFFIRINEPMLISWTGADVLQLLADNLRSIVVDISTMSTQLFSDVDILPLLNKAPLESVGFHLSSLNESGMNGDERLSVVLGALIDRQHQLCIEHCSGKVETCLVNSSDCTPGSRGSLCAGNEAAGTNQKQSHCQCERQTHCQCEVPSSQTHPLCQRRRCGVKRLVFDSVFMVFETTCLARYLPHFTCLQELSLVNTTVTADLFDALLVLRPGLEVLVLSGAFGFDDERTGQAFQRLLHSPRTPRPLRCLDISDSESLSSLLPSLLDLRCAKGSTVPTCTKCWTVEESSPKRTCCAETEDGRDSSDEDIWSDVFSMPSAAYSKQTLTNSAKGRSCCSSSGCTLSCIAELCLSSFPLGNVSVEALACKVPSFGSLEMLNLSECSLSSDQLLQLCKAVNSHGGVQQVDLSSNSFGGGSSDAAALCALLGCNSIRRLDLGFCSLHNIVCAYPKLLPSLLQCCHLEQFGLAGNRLGTLPRLIIQDVLAALFNIECLLVLSLRSNLWSPSVLINDLPEAIGCRNRPLYRLDIKGRLLGGSQVDVDKLRQCLYSSVVHLEAPMTCEREVLFADYISEM